MARARYRLYLPTMIVLAAAAGLSWLGWDTLGDFGPARAVRPVPVEQAGRQARYVRTFLIQWAEPFVTIPGVHTTGTQTMASAAPAIETMNEVPT